MKDILVNLRQTLIANSDEENRLGAKRYFKEAIECYGIRNATVSSIGKEYYKQLKGIPKSELFDLCDDLWQSGMMEESFIACHWSYAIHKKFEPADFEIFEKWVHNNITNWASCDTFCNHTVGEFIEMYPEFLSRLKVWTSSGNRWVKRASAVSLIVPGKKGKFLEDIFEIADLLMLDSDDMVQKGYGWMLKVASQAHQQEVFEYIMKHKHHMPRTALRYAIEKMPAELKAEAMKR
jgi:3-methyladenine DNA glycosylase AlkD